MSANEFDIGPLTWVKGEIEQALGRARDALAKYQADPADSAQLKHCKTHLHQAHGALEIVGLDGVTRLTEESERLIDAVDGGHLRINAEIGAALANCFAAITGYLDLLVEGAPHQPVRLFPAYRAVMQARGAERIAESDLFYPDITLRPPKREVRELPVNMRDHIAAQRRRFQAGLLRWLRDSGDMPALKEMIDAVRAIERTQALPQHRAFWWVTIGFAESLVEGGARGAGMEAKRLCARIDLQMKRLLEGSQSVAERLLRDALYFVARSKVQSPQVLEIRRLYALDGELPPENQAQVDTRPDAANLRDLREILDAAKDKWNRFSSGQTHELAGFREQAKLLRERTMALGNADLALLVAALASVTVWVSEDPGRITESIALETATALLLAESAVANFARLPAEFPSQVVAMGARLNASLYGQVADAPDVPMLDEMSRKAQERLLMAQVVSEIKTNLAQIESTLDGFFRDAGRRGELASLDSLIRQVSGALSIIGAEQAVAALAGCHAEITRFSSAEYAPDLADFQAVAQTMSGLGFFIEALQHGPADFNALMQPITPRRARADIVGEATVESTAAGVEAATTEVEMSVEAELAQQRRDARTLFEAWRESPGDSVLGAELKANIEAIEQDADLVDERALRGSASRMLELLDQPESATPAIADLEKAMDQVAPAPEPAIVHVPSQQVRELARASDEAVDAELLGVFLEEAGEVLANIAARRGQLDAEPTNQDLLITIRRGFHTLKGSGRMVGLARLGDAAWAIEQTMNYWLQEARPASADLLALIDGAHGIFDRWVGDLAANGVSDVESTALVAAAERVMRGEPYAVPPPPAITPVAPTVAEQDHQPGAVQVSPGLYGIFVEEAGTHIATIRAELALLRDEPQPPRDELVRAVHTLAGIAGTVSYGGLHELGRSFERLLLIARSGGVVPEAIDLDLCDEVTSTLDSMVGSIFAAKAPPAVDGLEARLEVKRAEWLAVSGEIEAALMSGNAPPLPELLETAPPNAELDIAFGDALGRDRVEAPESVATEPVDVPRPATKDSLLAPTVDFDFSQGGESAVDTVVIDFSAIPEQALQTAAHEAAPLAAKIPVEAEGPPDAGASAIVEAESTMEVPVVAESPPVVEVMPVVEAGPVVETPVIADALTDVEAAHEAPPIEVVVAPVAVGTAPSDAELLESYEPQDAAADLIEDDIDLQLLPVFLEEAAELSPRLGSLLRAWSASPLERGHAQSLLRVLHTLKGGARMAGAMAFGQLTHGIETRVENAMRLPRIPAPAFDRLLSSCDRVEMMLEGLRGYQPERKTTIAASARALLEAEVTREMVPVAPPVTQEQAAAATASEPAALLYAPPSQGPFAEPVDAAAEEPRALLRVRADIVDRLVNEAGEVSIGRARIESELFAVKANLTDLNESVARLRIQLREIEIAAESQIQSRQRDALERHEDFDPLEIDRFTRFQEITRMMAESVNDVATVQQHLVKNLDDADAALVAQARTNRDLQMDLMRVRMVPFNSVAERLYRVLRQTAKELGKRANLDISGVRTEIDRSVLERMTGPFEHLLRNSLAHGIEDSAGRAAAGKDEIGQIVLGARQEGNEFVLVFEDDGRGLDLAGIRARANAMGLIREGDTLSDAQVAEFIFTPGFSTATGVSEISGRGVGMDVVRAEVAALGGRIDTDFTVGKGTRFTISLPLTLAVTQVVLVRVGQLLFAIPSVTVEHVKQVRAEELSAAYGAGAFDWQGRTYPLFYLPRLLGDSRKSAPAQHLTPVLLLRSGTQRAAIHVDEMAGNQEVVVKNIGPQLSRVTGIAGATVLGDGRIVLILNPVPLAQRLGLQAHQGGAPAIAAPPDTTVRPPTVMVVDDSLTVRKVTSRLLARESYEVVTARDGIDALEQLQGMRPDIMLVDIEMPRMDGFDLTRNVRADRRTADIPIIMITSRTAEKHRKYAREIGVDVFLGKPFQENELLQNIATLLRKVVPVE